MTTSQKYTKQSGERAPLLTDQQDTERILSDYEQTIEELLTRIKDVREEAFVRNVSKKTTLEGKSTMRRLNTQLSELHETLQQEPRPETTTNQTQTENERQVHMEGDAIHEDEQEKIMENVEYM
uniref:Uncharacterized protein n=1 Tax=Haemonchus placei TaxID=6290 RepID=A0A0N4WNN0_HAEPC